MNAAAVIFVALLGFCALFGYGSNIYKFVHCDFSPDTSYKCEVVHGIGIIPIVGIFTGYMDFDK